MDISRKILADPIVEWVFSNSENKTYLVGGFLRDLITGKRSADRDFAIRNNAREIAVKCSHRFNGTYIELKENHTYRVVINNDNVVDFSSLDGTIVNDLNNRDYTMNAVAWSPAEGIIDPLNGRVSIADREVRMVSKHNLLNDPLRLLRAYRLAAQTGFYIEADTRRHLEKYSANISNSASERITDELFRLLSLSNALKYLELCRDDGLLGHVIGGTAKDIDKNIKLIKELEHKIKNLKRMADNELFSKKVLRYLDQNAGQGLNVSGLIRLALLLLNSSRQSKEPDPGLLRPSNIVMKKASCIINGCRTANTRITDNKLFEIYCRSENAVYETALGLSTIKKRGLKRFLICAERFNKIKNNCLVTGDEIKEILNIKPGKVIGEIKKDICRLQFLKKLTKKQDARRWIISNLT